jgi:hypothetical protein
MSEEKPFLCGICFQPIDWKHCRVDSNGRAVHEECFTEMLLHTPIEKSSKGKSRHFWGRGGASGER